MPGRWGGVACPSPPDPMVVWGGCLPWHTPARTSDILRTWSCRSACRIGPGGRRNPRRPARSSCLPRSPGRRRPPEPPPLERNPFVTGLAALEYSCSHIQPCQPYLCSLHLLLVRLPSTLPEC